MPTVLVTGPTVVQNLPFFFLAVAVTITIARTHFVDLQMDDQAELVWLGGLVKCQGGISQNGHPSQC